MSMRPRELREWAKEEVSDGLAEWLKTRLEDRTLDFDDREALTKEVARVQRHIKVDRKQS